MADTGQIGPIISADEQIAALNKVIDGVSLLIKEIEAANGKTIALQVDLKGAESLQAIIDATKEAKGALTDLNTTAKDSKIVFEQVKNVQDSFTKSNLDNVEALKDLKLEQAYVNQQVKLFSKDIKSGRDNTDQANAALTGYIKRQQELRVEIASTTLAIKKQIQENQAEVDSIDEKRAKLIILQRQYDGMSGAMRTTTETGKQLQVQILGLTDELKELEAATGRNQRNVGNYTDSIVKASAEIERLTKLMAEQRVETEADAKAYMDYEEQLLKVKAAAAGLGPTGGAMGGVTATTSSIIPISAQLSTVKAQMQQLAVAGKADSVEFKELSMRAQELSASMRLVARETGRATFSIENLSKRIETMGFRMLVHLAIFTLVIEAATALWEWMTKLSDAEQLAKDRMEEYDSSAKSLAKTLADLKANTDAAILFDKSKADSQLAILKDTNLTLDQRFKAYKALQGIAPDILDDLDKEGVKTALNSKRFEEQVANMNTYIELQEKINKGREAQNSNIQQQQKNEAEQGDVKAALKKYYGSGLFGFGKHDVSDEELNGLVSNSGSEHGLMEDDHTKNAVELNKLRKERAELDARAITDNKSLADLERQRAALQGNTKDKKDKKPPKDNAKELNAELEEEQRDFEKKMLQAKREFDAKDNREEEAKFLHTKQLIDKEKQITKDHGDAMIAIIADWHGKVGESQSKFTDRMYKAIDDQIKEENRLAEEQKRNTEEFKKNQIEKEKALKAEVEKYVKAAEEIRNIDAQIESVRQKAAIDHKEANGLNPLLQGLGIDTGDLADIKKRNVDIETQQNKIDNANNNINAESKKDLPDPNKIMAWQKEVKDGELSLSQLESDQQAAMDGKIIEGKRKVGELTVQLAQQTFDAINTIRNNAFAQEQQQLQIQQQQLQISSQQKIAAINAEAGFQISKDNEVAKVVAQTTAQQNNITQQQNQLALKKAKADKEAAEAGILMSTALAISKTLPMLSNPLTATIGAAEIALITAIGAAQYAAAASTPLPQFFTGGYTETPIFSAAEKGREIGTTPSGQSIMFDKPGIYSAPIGTKILPNDETERLIRYAINGIGFNGDILSGMQVTTNTISTKKLEDKLDDLTDATIQAAMIGRTIKNNLTINIKNPLQRK